MMMPRKKRRAIFISVIVAIILLIAITCIVLYSTTDMFKSNAVLFQKYALQLFDGIDVFINEENMSEIEEIINNNKLVSDTTVSINYTENGDTSNPINNIQINIAGQEEKSEGYRYDDVSLVQDEETLLGLEYIEDGEVAGVRLNGIRQYVSTNIDNEDENSLNALYNLINTDIKDVIGFTSEELNTIIDKYRNIVLTNITNFTFSKQAGVVLEINGTSYTTNAYSVSMTKEQYNNIYVQILEELKEDEIILSKLEALDNTINEYHNLIQDGETSNLEQTFINEITTKIQQIQDFNIGNDERVITVYECNGVTISMSIDTEEETIGADFINSDGSSYIYISQSEKVEEDEEENSFNFTVEKVTQINNETININYTKVEEGETTTNQYSSSKQMENSNINYDINISRSVEENIAEIEINKTATVVDNFEEIEELVENDNNIILENLTDEQRESARDTIEQNINNQLETMYQTVPLEDIQQMLISLDLMEEELDDLSNDGTITELERTRFNSVFELYEGENISKERIEELIELAGEDLADVRITDYQDGRNENIPSAYRLVIERGTDNSELAETVIEYIEENYSNEEFTVELEYDETTGLIANIYITMIEDN